MSSERRQHYRVSPNAVREVRVSVRDSDGRDHIVGLVDISAGGVALACSVADAPPIKLMDEVVIVFESERLLRPLSIRSQIRHIKVSDDDANIVYGVRFLDWNEERQRLAPKLRALFNEREAVRVDPREDHEIEVELVINGTARVASGLLRDISVLGVGVWVSTAGHNMPKGGKEPGGQGSRSQVTHHRSTWRRSDCKRARRAARPVQSR